MSPDEPLVVPDRDREYPSVGPDVYGAESEDLVPYVALSDNADPATLAAAVGTTSDGVGATDSVGAADGALSAAPLAPPPSVDVALDDAWDEPEPAVAGAATGDGSPVDDAGAARPAPAAPSSEPEVAQPAGATEVKDHPR